MKKTKSLGVNYQDSVSRKRKTHKIPQTLARKGHLTKLMQTRRFMREKNKEAIHYINYEVYVSIVTVYITALGCKV